MTDTVSVEVYRAFGSRVALWSAKAYQNRPPEQVETRLLGLAAQASAPAASAPVRPGVGLDWLLLDGAWDGEVVNATFRSPQWRDVVVEMATNSVVQEFDGGLLKRWNERAGGFVAAGFSVRTIRKGAVTMAGARAEELLTDGQEHGKLRRDFNAETLPKPSSESQPHMKLALRMGGQVDENYVDPALTEADSLALWKTAMDSIKAVGAA